MLLRDWTTFTAVRNPYIKVYAGLRQRKDRDRFYGSDYPRDDINEYVEWLEQKVLIEKSLQWCCSETLTHLRPNTMYSLFENGMPAVMKVFKLEDSEKIVQYLAEHFPDNPLKQLEHHNGRKGTKA